MHWKHQVIHSPERGQTFSGWGDCVDPAGTKTAATKLDDACSRSGAQEGHPATVPQLAKAASTAEALSERLLDSQDEELYAGVRSGRQNGNGC